VICPTPLGVGVNTKLEHCDVMSERDPRPGSSSDPEHKGPVTRQRSRTTATRSKRQVRSANPCIALHGHRRCPDDGQHTSYAGGRAKRVQKSDRLRRSHRRRRRSRGESAVGPTGTESVSVVIPEEEMQVSVLGEKGYRRGVDGTAPIPLAGAAVAIINVMIEYRPAPPPKPAAAARRSAKTARRLLAGPRVETRNWRRTTQSWFLCSTC
jgi:hypothetical protein